MVKKIIDLESLNHEVIHEVLVHKYLESERAGKDLGESAIFDWIDRHYKKWLEANLYRFLVDKKNGGEKKRGRTENER